MNEKLARVFDKLAKQFKGERYRSRAYKNAATGIRNYQGTIISGKQAQKDIDGVGKGIAVKIDEFLESGTLSIIENQDPEEKQRELVIELFEGIHGVGPVTAAKWYSMGYRTIPDLCKIYDHMTESQKLGYIYYYHLQTRIPRAEMDIISKIISDIISSINATYQICGSYRRGEADSGDIDCLIKGTDNINMLTIINQIKTTGIIIGDLAVGSAKYMGICRLSQNHCARRIDLMIVAEESWPYATLYFTGSKNLNVKMRSKALDLGMSMNEYGMVGTDGQEYMAETEEDIFKYLKMDYIEPTKRSL